MFVKAQLASFFATVIDFLAAILLKSVFKLDPLPSSMLGLVAGGIFHFSVSRYWVFSATEKDKLFQIIKYGLVWGGNFVLNSAGLSLILQYAPFIKFAIAKALVAIVVGISYNYVLQKRFVFK